MLYINNTFNEEELLTLYSQRLNVFYGFLNSFDFQFEDEVYFSNNIFEKGCNLFGNKGQGFENMFDCGVVKDGRYGKNYFL